MDETSDKSLRKAKPKAYTYIRMSTVAQLQVDSLRRQIQLDNSLNLGWSLELSFGLSLDFAIMAVLGGSISPP